MDDFNSNNENRDPKSTSFKRAADDFVGPQNKKRRKIMTSSPIRVNSKASSEIVVIDLTDEPDEPPAARATGGAKKQEKRRMIGMRNVPVSSRYV